MDGQQDIKQDKMNNNTASGETTAAAIESEEITATGAEKEEAPPVTVEATGPAEPAGENKAAELAEELAQLRAELDDKRATLTELQQRYLRLQADFDNYRKRTRREQEEQTRLANARLMANLLPILDNLERALAAATEADKQALATGVEMILRHLKEVLGQEGLLPIATLGQPFNPELHEAVAREETREQDKVNLVVEEFRRGYTLHGKLLRPAMVKVAVATNASDREKEQDSGE